MRRRDKLKEKKWKEREGSHKIRKMETGKCWKECKKERESENNYKEY